MEKQEQKERGGAGREGERERTTNSNGSWMIENWNAWQSPA